MAPRSRGMRWIVIAAVVIATAAAWAVFGSRSSVESPGERSVPPEVARPPAPSTPSVPAVPAVERDSSRAAKRKIVVHVLGGDGKPVASVVGLLDSAAASGSSAASTWQSTPGADLTFDVAPESEAWITVAGAFDEKGARLPWAQARYGPLREDETEVTIRLARALTLEGRVLGPGGDGLVGAKFRVRMDVRHGGADLDGRTLSGGAFLVEGLGDG